MIADTLDRAFTAFARLADLSGEDRDRALADLERSDPEAAREVRSLLGFHAPDDGFLDPSRLRRGFEAIELEPLSPGMQLRGYTVQGRLGSGGSSVVYLAEQQRPRRRVALKVLGVGHGGPAMVRRLEREADLLGRLAHPGIAQIYEAGVEDLGDGDRAFMALELVEGLPIDQHCARRGLDDRARIRLLLEVCDALRHAHLSGVVHLDLKPANILVREDGAVKVLDFGVGRDLLAGEHGGPMGVTLAYAAPELFGRDEPPDMRADVFALGVILYQLLTGRRPVEPSELDAADADRTLRERPRPPLRLARPELSPDLEGVAARALALRPDDRYQSVGEFAEDLRRFLDDRPVSARQESAIDALRRAVRRGQRLIATGVAAVLVLAGATVFAVFSAVRSDALAKSEEAARTLAEREQARADEFNALLQAELAAADIERARLEARVGNGFAAETILWPAYFLDPDSPAVQGALWELFETHPCDWTVFVPSAFRVTPTADGDRLVIGSRDGSLTLLDAHTGRTLASIAPDEDTSPIVAMADAPRDRVWSVQRSGRVRILTAEPDRLGVVEVRTLDPNPTALALHPVAGLSAVCFADGRVLLGTIDSPEPIRSWRASGQLLRAVAFDPAGRRLAVCGADLVIRLYSARDGELRGELHGHERDIHTLAFDPAAPGTVLRSMAQDQTLRRWDLPSGASTIEAMIEDHPVLIAHRTDGAIVLGETERAWIMHAPGGSLRSIAFPRAGFAHAAALPDAVVTVESTGEVRRWSTNASPSISRIAAHRLWLFGIDRSAPRDRMVTSAGDGTIRFADATGTHEIARYELPPRSRARAVRFSPDHARVAVGCADGQIRLFDSETGTLVGTVPGPGGEVYALAFSPDGTRLAAGTSGRTIRLWSWPDLAIAGELTGLDAVPKGLAFAPGSDRLYASGARRGVLVIDPASPAIVDTIPTAAEPWSVVLSPDGRTLAAGLFDASVICVDLPTGSVRVGTTRHRLVVAGLDFSPDGRLLVSGGDDGAIRLWDTRDPGLRVVRALGAFAGPVPIVKFEPTGDRVLAGTSTGKLIGWSLNTHDARIRGNAEDARRRFSRE
jgi:WD40 repeat protein/predicted Ser/Thr protein kinase